MKIGKQIKDRRKNRGFSQAQVAEKTGLSVAYISMIESDKRDPNLSVIEKICSALDIHVYDLMIEYIVEGRKDTPEGRKQLAKLKKALNALIGEVV